MTGSEWNGFMLAQEALEVPRDLGPGWIYQRKLNGCRAAFVDGRLISRAGVDVTELFPELKWLSYEPEGRILDGELWRDDDLSYLKRRMALRDPLKVEVESLRQPVRFMIFDRPDTNDTLLARKPLGSAVEQFEDFAYAWGLVTSLDWEGLVAKKIDSLYTPGRSSVWLKMKP